MADRYVGKAIVFAKLLHAEVRTDVLLPKMDEDGLALKTLFSRLSQGTEEMNLDEGQSQLLSPSDLQSAPRQTTEDGGTPLIWSGALKQVLTSSSNALIAAYQR